MFYGRGAKRRAQPHSPLARAVHGAGPFEILPLEILEVKSNKRI